MNVSPVTPAEIVTAVVTMLSPYVSGLSSGALLQALESYNKNTNSPERDTRPPLKPLTRKEAARMLGISVSSADRYLRNGLLTPVRYSARAIRISAESVYNLMKGGEA